MNLDTARLVKFGVMRQTMVYKWTASSVYSSLLAYP